MVEIGKKARARKLALIGAETLMGRELQEVLQNLSSPDLLVPYAATGEGNFAEEDGEAVYREPFNAQSLADTQGVLVAGSETGALKAYQIVREYNAKSGQEIVLIDCSGYLDSQPNARIVASLLEQPSVEAGDVLVLAHPAASALAVVLTRLQRYRQIRRAVVQIFEPASERGKRGISELHQQTTSLLAFKPLEKDVFDTQLSFNLLAQYGTEAPQQLGEIEQRIEKHLATLLSRFKSDGSTGESIPFPSLRLIQAPVFHGYSISAWVEFVSDVNAVELGEAVASAQIEVRTKEEEAPTGVGMAGQSGLAVGDIRVDKNDGHSAWFWIVGDNLRLAADAVAEILSELEMKK